MAKRKKKKKQEGLFTKLFTSEKPLFSFDIHEQAAREVTAIVLALLAVFCLLSLVGFAGSLGSLLNTLLRSLFGWVAFLLPLLLIYGAYEFFKPKANGIRFLAFIGAGLIVVFLPALIHLIWPGDKLELAQNSLGGGLVGYFVSSNIQNAAGNMVAFLLVVACVLIGLILISNIPLAQMFGLVAREEGDVRINQPGRAPVFETIRRFGLGRRAAPTVPVQQPPLAPQGALTALSVHGYQLPGTDLLENSDVVAESGDIPKNVEKIQKTLKDFGMTVTMGEVNVGPTVTQYTCKPSEGVKLNQITARANDLALSLAAKSIRIEAPIPGKAAVGIEVPNKVRAKVTLREILEAPEFTKMHSKLGLALGRDVAGAPIAIDLETMPHCLIAGATGSGKSVMINSLLLSLLYQNTPEDLRFILVDPKRVELSGYNHLPHLLTPVITEPDKTISALKWAVSEMDRRYRLFSEVGRRNIQAFNESMPEGQRHMPKIVLVIDELADLMSVAARDVEGSIVRLSQMARATGIHLVVATQRPSVDVITGLIKANITTRIAFATASLTDSRTILDQSGAEKLLGNGDLLFVTSDLSKPRRVQGSFASDKDINNVITFVKSQGMAQYDEGIVSEHHTPGSVTGQGSGGGVGEDDLYNDAVAVVSEAGKASASLLQRRLRIGYARAARLLDILEEQGVIGPADGARPREVYSQAAAAASATSRPPASSGLPPADNGYGNPPDSDQKNNIQPY